MPWTSIKDVSPALKAIEPAVTLRQANQIALWADRMEASDVEGAWPMAHGYTPVQASVHGH